jgi:phenylacetate-CoA ligase
MGIEAMKQPKSRFEYYLDFKGYNITQAYNDLSVVSALSRSQLDTWIASTKQEILNFHFKNNPLYRSKIGSTLPTRWEDLPVMEKADYQRDLQSVISDGLRKDDLYVANTSGSSGHPFYFAKDKYAHARTWALIKQRYGWHGVLFTSKQARFYGIPLEPLRYWKEKAKDAVMNRSRFPVFDLSDGVLKTFHTRFVNSAFEYIYGYTSSLCLFARYLVQNNIVLGRDAPKLRLCIVTSEVCTDEDRNLLKQAFGVPVVNEYGASEIGLIAFENPAEEWVTSEESLFLEVVGENGQPVKPGMPGDLLVTDLFNRAMPFIRYRVGDVVTMAPPNNSSADVRAKLLRLEGRTNDVIVLPSGRRSAGLTFYYITRSILESSGCLKEFIVRQTALDEFTFDVVSDRDISPEERASIEKTLEAYLEPGLRLVINRVSVINRPASGKIKHFFSQIR